MENWKNRIYESYMTNGFKDAHDNKNEYLIHDMYFKKNYLKYLPVNRNARILELGCGMGHFAHFCVGEGYKNYTGIDASAENIAHIKKTFRKKLDVRVMDIMDFLGEEERENTYNAVIFNDVIEHLTKPEIMKVLDSIYRVLAPGGVLLAKTPNMANPYVSTAGRYIDITHEVGFTEKSMSQVLRATGYCNIKIIGTDIYILDPLVSVLAKIVSWIINKILFLFSALYGRTSLHIFEKDILAIAYKKER